MKSRKSRVEQIIKQSSASEQKLPSIIIHFIPDTIDAPLQFNEDQIIEQLKVSIQPIGCSSSDTMYNFMGYKVFAKGYDNVEQYVQLFRNGAIEFYNTQLFQVDQKGTKYAWGNHLNKAINDAFQMAKIFFNLYNISAPIKFNLTILNSKHLVIITEQQIHIPRKIKLDNLFFPKLIIEDLTDIALDQAVNYVLNHVWQTSGYSKNEEGNT